ncbi:MAG: HAD family hydrolase [Granulosicoccus sp.]
MKESTANSNRTPGMSQATRSLEQIQAISFDLDDTLWHCAPAIENAERALYEWHKRVTPRLAQAHTPETLLAYRNLFRSQHPQLQNCVTEMRLAGLRALLQQFDYPQSLAEEGFAVFYRARSEVQLYTGALELLNTLGKRYRLAAITNGNADLEYIGIADHFEQIYSANLNMRPKPDAHMFDHCLAALDLPAEKLLHIGDNPVTDISGGHNAGVQTLWFNQFGELWPEHLVRPHYEVQALAGIIALFDG